MTAHASHHIGILVLMFSIALGCGGTTQSSPTSATSPTSSSASSALFGDYIEALKKRTDETKDSACLFDAQKPAVSFSSPFQNRIHRANDTDVLLAENAHLLGRYGKRGLTGLAFAPIAGEIGLSAQASIIWIHTDGFIVFSTNGQKAQFADTNTLRNHIHALEPQEIFISAPFSLALSKVIHVVEQIDQGQHSFGIALPLPAELKMRQKTPKAPRCNEVPLPENEVDSSEFTQEAALRFKQSFQPSECATALFASDPLKARVLVEFKDQTLSGVCFSQHAHNQQHELALMCVAKHLRTMAASTPNVRLSIPLQLRRRPHWRTKALCDAQE